MRKVALVVASFAALLLPTVPAAAQEPLTVHVSMPTHSAARPQTTELLRGARLALQHAGGQAAGRPVRLVERSSSSARAGTWTPERVFANARRAAADPSTVAYLGEFNSGGSAISIPILNKQGILQVSPSNTANGLTFAGPGADPGEPDKYYPSGNRTYGRVIPTDDVQARALAAMAQADGARSVLVIHDGTLYGAGIGSEAAASARERGLQVTVRRLGRRARNRAALARTAKGADAVIYGGITSSGAVPLWKSLHRAKRALRLYGSDGVAESGFTERIPRAARARTQVSVSTLPASAMAPAAQEVDRALGGDVDPYALYGYEAMAVILDAITRGGGTRAGTVQAFFQTRDRDSILGRYSIVSSGDTTLTQYGRYGVDAAGRLVFAGTVDAGA